MGTEYAVEALGRGQPVPTWQNCVRSSEVVPCDYDSQPAIRARRRTCRGPRGRRGSQFHNIIVGIVMKWLQATEHAKGRGLGRRRRGRGTREGCTRTAVITMLIDPAGGKRRVPGIYALILPSRTATTSTIQTRLAAENRLIVHRQQKASLS